ncbi:MAG: gfo/Idh/MocA family oxidoreductase [Candidatus Omnitrophota bacterium]|jgi:predicted dehydrogenase|nr:MAG: gfo/Idh/MocA family oxidoreductase [Candidatus Omnitrophota bacterium]
MNTPEKTIRRTFLKTTGASSFWLGLSTALPSIVPQQVMGNNPPSDKVVIGNIGLGWRGNELLRGCVRNDNVQIAAICDLDMAFLIQRMQFLDTMADVDRQWIKGELWDTIPAPTPPGAADVYLDYRKLLDRQDIDGVIIAVPDHWHARLFLDALDAGKDVYGEKPITLTIGQGRKVVRRVAETGRIFQVGFQQRDHKNFQTVCEYVRNGRLGKLKKIRIIIHGTRLMDPVPDCPAPPTLDWERWLGPAPLVPYNPLRCHVFFRYFYEYSGGQVTDLGAHHTDVAQWALDMDHSGPRFIEGDCAVNPANAFNTFTEYHFKLTYDNGVELTIESGDGFDMIFEGEKGQIFVNRAKIESNPIDILQEPITSNKIRLVEENSEFSSENEGYISSTSIHIQKWVNAIKTRIQPNTPAEIGHRSSTVSHLANICGWVKRKLEWDPVKELFVNDTEANSYLNRPEREPYDT